MNVVELYLFGCFVRGMIAKVEMGEGNFHG